MSDECEDRKYDREYLDNSDVVIEKLKKQARRYKVVESRYNAKESILGNPCLDIEWHTAPLPKQCYCPVEPCICTSHLLKQGNLPESIPVDTYRKATKEPDGTLIPRLAAAVEAEVEISSQLAQCGQLKDRGPEFCASHCPAFLTPVKESGFYAQKRKLIEKYIKDNKLEKKMQRLLNLKTNDLMRTKYSSKKGSQREVTELPEINIPKTVVTSRPVARRKKLTEKEEVEELEQILGIESHKDEPETLLRSSKSSLHPDKDSLSSTKGRPCGGLTSALTSKRDSEHSRGPSCDSEAIQPTESELNRAYNKIRSFKLKHLCEEDPMPKFSPTKRMVELKPRPKSNRIEDCVATSEEIAAKKKACKDDSKGPFKPEAKQVTSLYECKPRPISESELLSEPKKVLSGEPKRISEPELRRIFEPRRMSLDDPKLSNQLRKMPDLKRKPENESGITDDAANTYDPKAKPLIEITKSIDDPKTTITSGHVLGQTSFPKRIADDEHRPTSQHVRTLDLEPKQTKEDANDSKFEETNKRESKRTEDRKPVNDNESKRTFGYKRTKKESKQVCEPKPSLKIENGGASETTPRISEFRKLFESKRKSNSKTKQISSNERKCDIEVKKPPGDESKLQPESKKKPVEEPKRQEEQRRTAREASKYTSRGDLKQISDARRTPELGSRQTSELRQPCGATTTIILSSAHPSRASMPSPASAGSGHSKHSTKSDKSLCDDKKDKGLGKRSDSAPTASGASSKDASAKETDKPCPCFEDELDSTKTRGRRPGKDENCLCKAKECLSKVGANPSDDKGPIGRTYHSVI